MGSEDFEFARRKAAQFRESERIAKLTARGVGPYVEPPPLNIGRATRPAPTDSFGFTAQERTFIRDAITSAHNASDKSQDIKDFAADLMGDNARLKKAFDSHNDEITRGR